MLARVAWHRPMPTGAEQARLGIRRIGTCCGAPPGAEWGSGVRPLESSGASPEQMTRPRLNHEKPSTVLHQDMKPRLGRTASRVRTRGMKQHLTKVGQTLQTKERGRLIGREGRRGLAGWVCGRTRTGRTCAPGARQRSNEALRELLPSSSPVKAAATRRMQEELPSACVAQHGATAFVMTVSAPGERLRLPLWGTLRQRRHHIIDGWKGRRLPGRSQFASVCATNGPEAISKQTGRSRGRWGNGETRECPHGTAGWWSYDRRGGRTSGWEPLKLKERERSAARVAALTACVMAAMTSTNAGARFEPQPRRRIGPGRNVGSAARMPSVAQLPVYHSRAMTQWRPLRRADLGQLGSWTAGGGARSRAQSPPVQLETGRPEARRAAPRGQRTGPES